MSTLPTVELGVLGPLQVRQDGATVAIPGAKPRAILTVLGLHCGSVVSADTLVELLWGDDPPRTAGKALQTHISSLRHTLGDGFVLTEGTGWTLTGPEVDASRYKLAARIGRDAAAAGDTTGAVARFEEALALWRGIPELPDSQRGLSEKTRWIEGHAALLEDRADALLATGRAAEIIGELEAAVADAPLRERRWGQLMLALYRAGRQGEALGAYQRARTMLADELGVDPGPDLRRLEAAIVAQDAALDMPVSQHIPSVTRAVTFLLTDIEGSTAAWEADAPAMAVALARHDELVEQVVTSRGGRLIKTRGEGDATFSVFDRPSAAGAAAIELQDAIYHEPWALREPMRIRVALHTGEVELRDGDYFGRAVNRAARLRSLAIGGQILCSGATAELVIDSLPDDVVLADLGMRQLKNLARPEHVFELRLETGRPQASDSDEPPVERPGLPPVLAGHGPFVGRGRELERLLSAWQTALAGGMHAVLIAGEPGVGKTRLAGEWSRHAYEQGAVVLYGRCDEDLGAPYQPFAEALRSLMPCLGARRLREMRGVEALLPLVPGLTDVLPDLAAPPRADPDTERYALFDAVVALLGVASKDAPVVLILDDLHWAAKPTLLLLRHLLRFGEHARVQIIGTYRSTDLDRSHPLAAMLADLHRDATANRIQLSGLDEEEVTAYVAEAGYDDEELGRALASVTGGNPFFLIEALRHVEESGGHWDPSTLPQGVREAVSRRLSRLPAETNKALAAAAVVGSRFAVELVERVVGEDLVDAFDEACKAGIIIEEPGGRYRFNHAIVRQSLLAELASVRRMRLHQRIAATLESEHGADEERLAELAYHYFECAWAGNAAKAVEYCRRAADQAMARLAYEGAADLYDRALHALEELDEELPDRDDQIAELLVARCEALLAAGDVVSAAGAVAQLQEATHDSARLAAWGTCFDGQLSMLTDPERLDEIESAVGAAADRLAGLDDAAGEAKAHTVRAGCLARLGRIGDCEIALDHALTAARRAREHRRVNAVLAQAPLAALWGPNPVPRAGGRCLDVVRLLRITTDSPAVEATSTRCQAVLEAFRGRAAAGRRMIDSARRTVTELGLRHARLEVEQFAGIVELVADDPDAAEPHLRKAYKGFRRMGLDADTAETAALLARACLALDRDAEADELCSESERLAGHALKASIAWRTVRAQLLARQCAHDDARRMAEAAVGLAERTDLLVDHGDACLALATVLDAARDAAGARAAAERATELYETKGAAALADKARSLLSERTVPAAPLAPEAPAAKLDNACVQVLHRMDAALDSEAWGEIEKMYAPNVSVESRRKIVGFTPADISSGDWPRVARHLREGWAWHRSAIIAIRGERLALTRFELGTDDVSPGAPHEEMLQLHGLDEDGRIALQVFFDIDDIDAAIAELDARYLAGEAAPHAHTWSVIANGYAAVNRREFPPTTPDWMNFDHRRGTAFGPGDMSDFVRATQAATPDLRVHIEAVHRLTDFGTIVTVVATGTAQRGFEAEWRVITVWTVAGDLINRCELFDEADLDAAIARFDQLSRPARRLENAASEVCERFLERLAARDWDAMVQMVADDISFDDRRHVVNADLQIGRDLFIENYRTAADLDVTQTSDAIATRGERLVLIRSRHSRNDGDLEQFGLDLLHVIEIDADNRIAATATFDPDDFEAAIAELDTRYLAGEAAAYAHTWSVITDGYAALNRHELPGLTPDCVSIDHRLGTAFGPGEGIAYVRAGLDLDQDTRTYVEAVHRLSDLGVVCTHIGHQTSRQGFDAEWRLEIIYTVEGDLVSRCEVFDEADLDAAVAKFDQLAAPAARLENAARRVYEHFWRCFAARDWAGMAEMYAEDISVDDRRRPVGAGVLHGRELNIANMQALAEAGIADNTRSTAIATRGERLALSRLHSPAVQTEVLNAIEIDADERIAALVVFDIDDIEAAFAELDARYLAGEAAAYSHTWSLVSQTYSGFNRTELPPTTSDWVNVDRRRLVTIEEGGLKEYLRATMDATSRFSMHITAVHRLNHLGVVVTHTSHATSQEGLDAEWQDINLMTFDGDLINRCEIFDEADLDAALARFDELHPQTRRLENAASRLVERYLARFAYRHWDAMGKLLAEDFSTDDRRRVANAGVRRGREAEIANLRAIADIGTQNITSTVIATRGDRLVLNSTSVSVRDWPEEYHNVWLEVVEINADDQISAHVAFDPDDIDAVFEELDGRYLAGEAAAHANTWSVIAGAYAALNRRELPATTPDWASVDHRPYATIERNAVTPNIRAFWDLTSEARTDIEAVRRLSDFGAVISHATRAASHEGLEIESREVCILTVEVDRISRCEIYEEDDLDAALARFEELRPQTRRLENAASQVAERYWTHFAAGDLTAMADTLAADLSVDDRRRVVNAGIRHGRDVHIEDVRAAADVGFSNVTSAAIATRGAHLVLTRARYSIRDQRPEAFHNEVLHVGEIDAENRFAAVVVFDSDDVDAAFAELEARYLAGEAAAHAHTWSLIVATHAAFNRREICAMAPDLLDHRPLVTVEAGDPTADVRAMWDFTPDLRLYIEAVHRLSDFGAVFTQVSHGTSQAGFEAEWRVVELVTIDGDRVNRGELFEEADIDAAIARFEQLSRPLRPLENTAAQINECTQAYYMAGDWDAVAASLADDYYIDDRRRVVRDVLRQGRDVAVANLRASADLEIEVMASDVIATRGARLALSRTRWSGHDQQPDAFHTEALTIVEISANNQMAACVMFDPDDIDAAFVELDARYVVGEAAPYSHTWSVVAGTYTALNRHELPTTTPDFVNIDHHRGTPFASASDMTAAVRAFWDLMPDFSTHIEEVHRLSNLGAVVTQTTTGTSREGLAAEWREIGLVTVKGDLISRSEVFDESDLDAALARFDELSRPAHRLENAASQVYERIKTYFAARDWEAIKEILAEDISTEDRRRVVNAGLRRGRDAAIAEISSIAAVGVTNLATDVIATRGRRLALSRGRASAEDQGPGSFRSDLLDIVELDADERVVARVVFDPDDVDAAFEELDARYLAGDAAELSRTWSLIARAYAAANMHRLHELTPDCVNIDHRRGRAFAPGELTAYMDATWALVPDAKVYIEAVHRLSNLGAVVTHAVHGTSQGTFEAEWREVAILTFEGDRVNRSELFDEADIGAALAKFDELSRPVRQLENAASRADDRFFEHFGTRNWAAVAEILTDDSFIDDRRRVVNVGFWDGSDVVISNLRTLAESSANITSTVIATRGERLALSRICAPNRDAQHEEFGVEMLGIAEIDTDERILAHVLFDPDDIDAAFEELESRYLASEAAAHAHTWSVITRGYAAANRGELAATAPDLVNIDHRRLAMIESGGLIAYLRDTFDELANISTYLEAVHRLTEVGAVVTHVGTGTSAEGFDAEWRLINVIAVDGDLLSRSEMFDEADLDAALARFEELHSQTRRLENQASRVDERFWKYFAARDWAAMAEIVTDDISTSDRRQFVNAGVLNGRDAHIANLRAAAEVGAQNKRSVVIATRGERLALSRVRYSAREEGPKAFHTELLEIVEINPGQQIVATVGFDLNDIDAAFEELDARYLAGEAAARAHTWSVITGAFAAVNRRELPGLTADWVSIDHRRAIAFAPGDMTAYIRVTLEDAAVRVYIEAVHRLSDLGAVCTHAAQNISQLGFEAEWRQINISTIEGDLINRCELYDEADLDAALVRFEELQPPTRRLQNTASRAIERFQTCFAAGDWDAMAALLADDVSADDRRPVMSAGTRQGREVNIGDWRTVAEVGFTNIKSTVIALRGERLALGRFLISTGDHQAESFHNDVLGIVELNADNRIAACFMFDLDDIEGAFTELDARYIAGEAASHSRAWSVITQTYATFNRRELPPTTPDWVNIDHRHATSFAPGDTTAYLRATWDVAPDINIYIEAVHRLSDVGGVITHAAHGTSQEGFDAEWREITVFTVEGDLINRAEIFDDANIDAALARFEELQAQQRRLENAASHVAERYLTHFSARDWDSMAEILADDFLSDDRRRVVGAGVRHGRDAEIADMRAIAGLWGVDVTATAIATRGARLILSRARFSGGDKGPEAFHTEVLSLVEIDGDERIKATVQFDPGDIDAAFEELDARYLAGEGAAHADTWSLVIVGYAALNRHEVPPTTPHWENMDHRRGIAFAPGDMEQYILATFDVAPDIKIHAEAVHRLSDHGAVVTHAAYGTSHDGFDAEWREIVILLFVGELLNRSEMFDETDLDAALARFDELNQQVPQLENAATRAVSRAVDAFNRRDLDGLLAVHDGGYEDQRRGLRYEGSIGPTFARSVLSEAPDSWRMETEPVAIRGEQLALTRVRIRDSDEADRPIAVDNLMVTEVNHDELVSHSVNFDPDDINGAMGELTSRWIASGDVAHPDIIKSFDRVNATINRHDWDAVATHFAGATYVNHRQLAPGGDDTIADWLSSMQTIESLAPDFWVEFAEVLACSAKGIAGRIALKGTSTDGAAIEIPYVLLILLDGDRVTRFEVFDEDQRDLALARFHELRQSGQECPEQLRGAAWSASVPVGGAIAEIDTKAVD